MNNILNQDEIKRIKESGKILKNALDLVLSEIQPGVTTSYLDKIADENIVKQGGQPSFKNYEVRGVGRYPAALCVSVNDEIVHGLPSQRLLKEGDIVSLDLGVRYKDLCTDMAVTVGVGKISPEAEKLIKVTKECLNIGIKEAIIGNNIGAIGNAIQRHAESYGLGVVRELVGHGIGRMPHLEPKIPNYGEVREGPRIQEGMALAIEPMITLGDYEVKVKKDNWTVVTQDSSLAAHFEHTIVIIDGEPVIVTL